MEGDRKHAVSPASPRYALYFTPAWGTPWERFGARWLGRSLRPADAVVQAVVPGISADQLARITEAPRRYGFHATLKAPIRLVDGCSVEAFEAAVARTCRTLAPVPIEPLRVARLDDFLALVPCDDGAALRHVAATLTRALDPFRAPPGPRELARRRAAGLTPAQEANLVRWGYPHVFDDFRFHMTLSGSLAAVGADDVARLADAASAAIAALADTPLVLDAVSVCVEPGDGLPFVETTRHHLGAASA